MQTVVIDPDGTQSWGLLLVIPAETGTTYEAQCAGVAAEQRQIEGYLVPVGDQVASKALQDFFARQFRGNPPPYGGNDWTGDALDELADLVRQIPYWYRKPDGTDSRTMLSLNIDRVSELTEAWVPVRTADGDAILLFKNSDIQKEGGGRLGDPTLSKERMTWCFKERCNTGRPRLAVEGRPREDLAKVTANDELLADRRFGVDDVHPPTLEPAAQVALELVLDDQPGC